MIAFEVWHNGVKACTAGVEAGYLLALIRWSNTDDGDPEQAGDGDPEEADMEISGMTALRNRDLIWKSMQLKRGDEILLRLVDVGEGDVDRYESYVDLPVKGGSWSIDD